MRHQIAAAVFGTQLIAALGMTHFAFGQDLEQLCGEPLRPILRVEPRYPKVGVEEGITGEVTVEFTVAEDGAARDVVVVDSSHRLLAEAAIKAVEKWRYFQCASGAVITETFHFTAAD